jgi:hypothetical protein
MRLQKAQKQAVLKWVAEGLETDEINTRAATFEPAFTVTRRMVAHYRASRAVELAALQRSGEYKALTEGLALREERVGRLQRLASLMEKDLFGGFMWLEDVKMLGVGPTAEVVDFEKFNVAEVDAYRGVLDDIAKEMGQRRNIVEVKDWREQAKAEGVDPDALVEEWCAKVAQKTPDDSRNI